VSRPRRSTRSKPQLDAMEQRLALSQATAAPIAQAIANRPPAMIQLQQRISAQPQAQTQAKPSARLQVLADVQTQRQGVANEDPGDRRAAREAQREANRLQTEQRREQAQERREQQRKAHPAPTTPPKVQTETEDTGFSFKKIWKSLFSW